MAMSKQYSADFKAKVALAAIREDATIAGLSSRYKIHPNMITKWKREALDGMKDTFSRTGSLSRPDSVEEIRTLQAKIGELIVERDCLQRAFDRRASNEGGNRWNDATRSSVSANDASCLVFTVAVGTTRRRASAWTICV